MLNSLTPLPENERSPTINYETVIEYLTIHDKSSVQLLRSIDHDHFKMLCQLLTNAEMNKFNQVCMCRVEQTLKRLNENPILLHSYIGKSICLYQKFVKHKVEKKCSLMKIKNSKSMLRMSLVSGCCYHSTVRPS